MNHFIIIMLITSIASIGLAQVNVSTASNDNKVTTVTILQTADIHGQLEPHPEFFMKTRNLFLKKEED